MSNDFMIMKEVRESIITKNGQLVVSHVDYADRFNLRQDKVKDLIETYAESLAVFNPTVKTEDGNEIHSSLSKGTVNEATTDNSNHSLIMSEYVTVDRGSNGGTQQRLTYYLNENQCMFLVTLSRNNKSTVIAKQRLIEEFVMMKEQLKEDELVNKYIAITGLVQRFNKGTTRTYRSTIFRIADSSEGGIRTVIDHLDYGYKLLKQNKKEPFLKAMLIAYVEWWKNMRVYDADSMGTYGDYEFVRAELEKRNRMFARRSRGHLVGEH